MSVKIVCENVVKKYGDQVIIPGLSLEINEGEFFTLLGPSGCGKTTLLRMIAGFNSIEGGVIRFNDTVINSMAPGKRNIGMVFQNYAIFPHMNVSKNVAFGLTHRHIDPAEIEKRVSKMLGTVKIDALKDRMPAMLSGGQQQRVALARAIVIEPDVLLMDEPLSNLDAKLRVEMRNAIKEIQMGVNITTVYVTHDQEEAMAVSDRIAIMKDGVIQQLGSPREIYQRPANTFVATFIGHSAIMRGTLNEQKQLDLGGWIADMSAEPLAVEPGGGEVLVAVRPEEFTLSADGAGLSGVITHSVFLGLYSQNFVKLDNGTEIEFTVQRQSAVDRGFNRGDRVTLAVDTGKINVFSPDGARNYIEKIEKKEGA